MNTSVLSPSEVNDSYKISYLGYQSVHRKFLLKKTYNINDLLMTSRLAFTLLKFSRLFIILKGFEELNSFHDCSLNIRKLKGKNLKSFSSVQKTNK
ncbi:hypothetical protein BpHYR1_008986 [Brachionus plicatilis]|uniref:Uncharacterized protein n=1 Tax=Brachionus plicatilis TaxID=10195 RepID=A0A3M7RLD6_BRAPC|nr:hypothetical protein BpHYR1_008986 [Brachionus plicatilis]